MQRNSMRNIGRLSMTILHGKNAEKKLMMHTVLGHYIARKVRTRQTVCIDTPKSGYLAFTVTIKKWYVMTNGRMSLQ